MPSSVTITWRPASGTAADAGVAVAFDEPLLGGRQHAPQVHHEFVGDEVSLDVAWTAAEKVLLEPRQRATHRRIDFTA